jgi:F0F1-type ATP synthase membrane subunit c/vacuolar-type H+-ATPase subunit K
VGDEPATEDPGWPSIRYVLLALIPGVGIQLAKRRRADALVALRSVFLSFSGALVLFGVVLAVLGLPNGPVMPWLPILVAYAAASVLAVRFFVKPLDCSSPSKLAESYRTRFFLVIALSESVALFAFVFTFIGGPRWIYYVGGAFSIYRFWTVAPPTPSGIARDQARLEASGCELSLISALRGGPSGPPPSVGPELPPVPPFPPPFPPPQSPQRSF